MSAKVAICFNGLVGGTTGNDGKGYPLSPSIAYDHYDRHILSKNNVDIFIHSWSIKESEELLKLYSPVSYKFEKQREFNPWPLLFSQIKNIKFLMPIFRLYHLNFFSTVYNLSKRVNSRWYSTKKVLEQVREYELKNNFKYDYVMITRLDVAFFSDLVFTDYDPSLFYVPNRNAGPSYYGKYYWKPNHKQYDEAFNDLWFFSNSDFMYEFSHLYDEITKYSIRPPYAAKQKIKKITNKFKKILFYGDDFDVVRFYFFGEQ